MPTDPRAGGSPAANGSLAGLRVALVHDWLTGMRGGERCLEVFCEVFPGADLYTLIHIPGSVSPSIERLRIHASPLNRVPWLARNHRACLPLFPWAMEQIDVSGHDLVFSSSHCAAKAVRTGGIPHVSYCHTPVRYLWDRFEDYFGPGAPWRLRAAASLVAGPLRAWDVGSSSRVDRFIANSAHVARRIRRSYGREAQVIHPPVDLERFAPSREVDDYYLIVSALAPYKRIDVAVEAFRELGKPLVIAGKGPEEGRLRRLASGAANIRFVGWLSDEEVARRMSRARAFILPGEEDFGIAPLESMASGRPVIALGRGGALETIVDARHAAAADPTGVLFDEPAPAALAEAVGVLESIADGFDPVALRRHASRFSRPRFRREIEDAVAGFLAGRATPAEAPPLPPPDPPAPSARPRRLVSALGPAILDVSAAGDERGTSD